jgi:hypothetical protein
MYTIYIYIYTHEKPIYIRYAPCASCFNDRKAYVPKFVEKVWNPLFQSLAALSPSRAGQEARVPEVSLRERGECEIASSFSCLPCHDAERPTRGREAAGEALASNVVFLKRAAVVHDSSTTTSSACSSTSSPPWTPSTTSCTVQTNILEGRNLIVDH